VSAALAQDRRGKVEDWGLIYEAVSVDEGRRKAHTQPVAQQRMAVTMLVNWWLDIGGVVPWLSWDQQGRTLLLLADSLFGALGVQLLLAVGAADRVEMCSECGTPYLPKRRPQSGRDHYCGECGRNAAMRRASRKYSESKRGT
jgi:hypothetical protein